MANTQENSEQHMLYKVGLLLLALSVVLFGAEIIFRIAGVVPSPAMPDDDLGWRYAPRASYRITKEGFSEGRLNAFGCRDYEYNQKKDNAVFRLAVLGDSFTEGFGVGLEETFPKRSERLLNEQLTSKVEVLSFARSGMGTVEELITLRRDALSFDLDAVVLVFLPGNDITDALPATAALKRRPFASTSELGIQITYAFRDTRGYRMRKVINPMKRRSALLSYLATWHNARQQQRARSHIVDAQQKEESKLTPIDSLFTENPDPLMKQALQLNLSVLSEINEICQARDIFFAMVVLPAYTYEKRLDHKGINPYRVEEIIQQWCASHHVPCLPLGKVFSAEAEKGHIMHFDVRGTYGHFNERGHELVAKFFTEFLMRDLIPHTAFSSSTSLKK